MRALVLSVIVLLVCSAIACAQPSIDFAHTDYDFSVIGQEDKIEHVFEFINKGDQELVITKLSAS